MNQLTHVNTNRSIEKSFSIFDLSICQPRLAHVVVDYNVMYSKKGLLVVLEEH